MKPDSALIVFVREPVLGKVKTRLAKGIGDEKALVVYRFLLDHTLQICTDIDCIKEIYYADDVVTNDRWSLPGFNKNAQTGEDLGSRMYNAFKACFERGYTKVIIIGSDCYDLNTDIIDEAYRQLDRQEVVIGPTFDGGYYLLGLTQLLPEIFENKSWSTDLVMHQTLQDLRKKSLAFSLLDQLNDIDNAGDLKASGLEKLLLTSVDEIARP
ncbi:MAG: TIGR04282 family arsenosugar biosynthesis glycosyltransferase [Mucilaginibacter sp.]